MAEVVLNPYISFKGNAEEALNFYKSVFGGEAEINRFGDIPGMPVEEDKKDKIMHAVLRTGSFQLMLSDAMADDGFKFGENVSISFSGDDEVALTKYFEGLSDGAEIRQPLGPQPWGDTFGMLKDKFGIVWLINISKPKI